MTISSLGGVPEEDGPLPSVKVSKGKFALIVLGMLTRLLIGLVFILLMLDLVPKTSEDSVVYPVLMAVLGIVVYAWFFRRQVQGVYKSAYPTLRALESLILVAAMFLAIFTMAYVMVSIYDSQAFTEQLDSFSGYYYSLTVLATVGFGDIAPNTVIARSVTMVQMALDIAFIAVIIKVMSSAARKAIQQRAQREVEAQDQEHQQEQHH